jgi:hypothetical protein
MLKLVAIFTFVAAVCLAGDTEKRHKALASQSTPPEWRAGAVWRFVTTTPPGKPKPAILTFRVTAEPGVSCSYLLGWKDVWRKFVVIEGNTPFDRQPVYQVEGRALQINLSGDMCDAYDTIEGVLTGGVFTGQRTTSGWGHSQKVGTVRGSCVQR